MNNDQSPPRGKPQPISESRPHMKRQDGPSHPVLPAALLMIGVVVFLIVVSAVAVF